MFWEILDVASSVPLNMDTASSRPSAPREPLDQQMNRLDMAERLERLTMLTQAMWELLSKQAGVTEQMLAEKVREIDLRDGVADGKRTKTIKTCRACNKVMNRRHSKCLYCGADVLVESLFEQL